jgi:uncharacterized membrane protein
MKDFKSKQLYAFLGILTLLNIAVYAAFRKNTYYDFLLWNMFLAWIPPVLAGLAERVFQRKKGGARAFLLFLLGTAWLLFFPNSPYVVTDIVHLTVKKQAYFERGNYTFEYWYDAVVLLSFSWTCLLLGAASLYRFQSMIMRANNKAVSWCFVIAVSLLGAYGILLGRKYRLNSWDVLGDWRQVYDIVKQSWTIEAAKFCLAFGFFIFIVHLTFYFGMNHPDRRT